MEEWFGEKQTATLVENAVSEEEKRERAKEILFSNISVQRISPEEKKLSIDGISFENIFEEKQEFEEVKDLEKVDEPANETVAEEIFESSNENELLENKQILQEENKETAFYEEKKTKPQTNFKSRIKIAICACVLVLTCVCGWSIYNAVRVKTLTAELQAQEARYSVNVVKVITNIQKLDDLSNPNSITNLDELEKANIIKIVPKEESSPQSLDIKSNWFDRLCNWFSNLFK